MPNAKILGCPECGIGKDRTTHSYGSYRVYESGTLLKLKCKTCGSEQVYRYIRGGQPDGVEGIW